MASNDESLSHIEASLQRLSKPNAPAPETTIGDYAMHCEQRCVQALLGASDLPDPNEQQVKELEKLNRKPEAALNNLLGFHKQLDKHRSLPEDPRFYTQVGIDGLVQVLNSILASIAEPEAHIPGKLKKQASEGKAKERIKKLRVPEHTFIDTVDKVSNMLTTIANAFISEQPIVAADFEGCNLGREGTLSIMQLYIKAIDHVYLVDVHTLGASAFTTPADAHADVPFTLKGLLESRPSRSSSGTAAPTTTRSSPSSASPWTALWTSNS